MSGFGAFLSLHPASTRCVEQLERFRAAGCGYFLMNAICDAPEERDQLEVIAAEILPRLRTR